MKKPKVSVVIPVYNAGRYIEKCIASVVNQTLKDIEIIIVNDGSTDNSFDICKKYAENDKRIKLISQKNAGAASARNKGIEEAVGEWFIGIDADDWIDTDYLQKMYMEIEKDNGLDVVIANCKRIEKALNGDKVEKRTAFESEFVTDNRFDVIKLQANTLAARVNSCEGSGLIALRSIATPWDKLFNMNIIREHNLRFCPEAESREDILFNLNYFHYVKKAKYIHNYGYNYRVMPDSLSHGYSPKILERDKKALEMMYVYLDKIQNEDDVWINSIQQGVYVATVRFFIEEIKRYFFSSNNPMLIDECFMLLKDNCKKYNYKMAFYNVNLSDLSENEVGYVYAAKEEDVNKIYDIWKKGN